MYEMELQISNFARDGYLAADGAGFLGGQAAVAAIGQIHVNLLGGLILIATATLVSQLLILRYALVTMPRDEGAFRFSVKNVRMKRDTVLPLLNLAYPVSAEKMLFAAGR